MPQYYEPPENWNERGKIKITFKPWWRNVPGLKKLPLFVGSRVRFRVQTEKPGKRNPYALHMVQEFIDDTPINHFLFEEVDTNIETEPISMEGNLKLSFGYLHMPQRYDPLILTAHIQNTDRWLLGCAGLLVGAIITFFVTVAAGIALGILQIDKFWHIINPFWK
jgi:hypothetical protein